jgi:hypothetical protein
LQAALLKIHVGAADFREFDREQRRIWFELRLGNFADLNRSIWLWNDGHARHAREGKGKRQKGEVSTTRSLMSDKL